MKKSLSIVIIAVLVSLVLVSLSGCGRGTTTLNYNRYSNTANVTQENGELIDSWKLVDPDDEDVEIRWWVDANWDFYQLADLIYKRTGVKVKFETALKSDGTELSTMIAGHMPDVITITDYSTRVQLAEEGYVYSIDKLAENYAPSLLKRLSSELLSYYSGSDGHIYGLANNFYNDADIAEYSELDGHVLSNYAVVVRKDMINAYLKHMRESDPSFDQNKITTPSEFIKMALWVKDAYGLKNDNPTVLLSEFPTKASNGSISTSLSALMEFFNVPKEDSEGNLLYEYAQDEFREVVTFLNDLFTKHLMVSGNFSYTANDIISHIKNGRPFAVIGAIQNYSKGFAGYSAMGYNAQTKEFSDDHEYIPIILTNSKGEAPLLGDMTGRGLRVSMITKDAHREDRIIKVFDYLVSEQGQRECYYGAIEGEYYNFVVRPGETKTITVNGKTIEHTYTYGQIEWTDKAKELLGAPNGSGWYNAGIKQISLLQNPMYVMLSSVHGAEMDTYQFYTRFNQKCALIPYTYSKLGFKYNVDTSDKQIYNSMADLQAILEETWISDLPQIIMAENNEAALKKYESTLRKAKNKGYETWLQFQNLSFQANKNAMGIKFAYPMNDPNYKAPEVRLFGFYDEYKKPVPSYIAINE